MPDNLPPALFAGVIVLQVVVAGAFVFLFLRLRKALKALGLSINPFEAYKQIKERKGPPKNK